MNILNTDKPAGKVFFQLSRLVSCLEGPFLGNDPPRYPPIFIVGVPRSGTTLFYQTLCHCFELAHTPMLTNYMPFAPSFSTWCCKRVLSSYSSDFKSFYGSSKGLASPGEGVMWNLWFSKHKCYQSMDEMKRDKIREIIRFVGRSERIPNRPFINKNLRHNNRVGVLAELFPKAIFPVMLRNPRDVAVSLLIARRDIHKDMNKWYSVKPRSYDNLTHLSPERAVAGQIMGIIEDLREQMLRIGHDRFMAFRYEDFCDFPSAVIKRFSDLMNARGFDLRQRRKAPSPFEVRKGRTNQLSPNQISRIDKIFSEEFPEDIYADFPCLYYYGNCKDGLQERPPCL